MLPRFEEVKQRIKVEREVTGQSHCFSKPYGSVNNFLDKEHFRVRFIYFFNEAFVLHDLWQNL